MKAKNLKILKEFLKIEGKEAALDKVAEEAVELALAIIQYRCPTKLNKKKRLNDIYKELADVKIVVRKAELFLNKRKINRLVNKKLEEKKIKFKIGKLTPKQSKQNK